MFTAVYTISTIFSIHKLTSLIGIWDIKYGIYTGGLIHLVTLILLFFVVLQLKPGRFLIPLATYLTASGALASIYGIAQYIPELLKENSGYRIRSTIGEPNRLAFFLVAVLPLSFTLFLKQNKPLYKTLSFIALVLIFTAVILTFSRGAWIVASILLILSSLSNIQVLKTLPKKDKIYLSILSGFLLLILGSQSKLVFSRISSIANDLRLKKGSSYIRLLEWQTGFELFLHQPLIRKIIGTGPETLKFTYPPVRPAKLNEFYPEKTWQTSVLRNQYLHYLNTIGIIGLTSYLLIIDSIIKSFLKVKNKSPYQKGFFYTFLAITISSLFYYQTIISFCYFWATAAIILSFDKLHKIELKRSLFLKVVLSLTIIFAISGSIACLLISQSLVYAKQKKFPKAITITPFFDFLWRSYSDKLQGLALKTNDQTIIKEAISTAEKAFRINPLDPANFVYLHAALYQGSGYLKLDKNYQKRALQLAQRWTKLDPTNPIAFDALGLSLLDLGNLKEALDNFQKAIDLDSEYLVSYLHAGEALKQMGQINEAIIYYQKALEKKPDWPFAQKELEKTKTLLSK